MSLIGTDVPWPDPAAAGARRSVVAADLEIDGQVVSRGPIELHGKVVGSLLAPEIVVASSGEVNGEAIALNLTVLGKLQGQIRARNVTLASTSVVDADVFHERIAIEAGARFDGGLAR